MLSTTPTIFGMSIKTAPRGLCIPPPPLLSQFCSANSGPDSSSWLSGHDDAVRGMPRAGPGSFCPIRMRPSLVVQRRVWASRSLLSRHCYYSVLPCLLSSLGRTDWLGLHPLIINWTHQTHKDSLTRVQSDMSLRLILVPVSPSSPACSSVPPW